jgi:hypothetical protein
MHRIHGVLVLAAFGALTCGLLLAGCGKGKTSRLPEFGAPPKPTGEQIARVRQRAGEIAPVVEQTAPPLQPLPILRDWGVRETATDALARIGPAAVPALIHALRDPNPDVRNHAAQAIARMGPPAKAAVPELIIALQDSDWNVRRSAARALGQIGEGAQAAVPALIEVIRNPASDDPTPDSADSHRS